MAKRRADQLLVDRGLVETRSRAQALIMAGLVYAGPHADKPVKKAGDQLAEDMPLTLKGQDHPWVSRGGLKLAHALDEFQLEHKVKSPLMWELPLAALRMFCSRMGLRVSMP